jgi:hypothetical protein
MMVLRGAKRRLVISTVFGRVVFLHVLGLGVVPVQQVDGLLDR